jgi:hypothetical protein
MHNFFFKYLISVKHNFVKGYGKIFDVCKANPTDADVMLLNFIFAIGS